MHTSVYYATFSLRLLSWTVTPGGHHSALDAAQGVYG